MPRTKRQTIIDDIADRIRAGQLKPGDQLPTSPQIEATYDASTATVRAAMTVLKAQGLIEFTPGVGLFVK